jgi:hypothetical protein
VSRKPDKQAGEHKAIIVVRRRGHAGAVSPRILELPHLPGQAAGMNSRIRSSSSTSIRFIGDVLRLNERQTDLDLVP